MGMIFPYDVGPILINTLPPVLNVTKKKNRTFLTMPSYEKYNNLTVVII
jgi:hypothetical protein